MLKSREALASLFYFSLQARPLQRNFNNTSELNGLPPQATKIYLETVGGMLAEMRVKWSYHAPNVKTKIKTTK
ncbi:hypothetical protein C7T94_06745 [Pedobacter yulinensis]|uniref:Uncharacterized protein n=1 Tax=Pedobacter yulinensis TaxID=2126353 RepID=A0A2T3HPL8_9SPHI|nr:hypothetical protein C7T94_06745 [Pedobacter yulinensis]